MRYNYPYTNRKKINSKTKKTFLTNYELTINSKKEYDLILSRACTQRSYLLLSILFF